MKRLHIETPPAKKLVLRTYAQRRKPRRVLMTHIGRRRALAVVAPVRSPQLRRAPFAVTRKPPHWGCDVHTLEEKEMKHVWPWLAMAATAAALIWLVAD